MVVGQQNSHFAHGISLRNSPDPRNAIAQNAQKRIQQRGGVKKEMNLGTLAEEGRACFRATLRRSEILRPRISESTPLRQKNETILPTTWAARKKAHPKANAESKAEQEAGWFALPPKDNDGAVPNRELSIVTVLVIKAF
jgi:hypothetical protein